MTNHPTVILGGGADVPPSRDDMYVSGQQLYRFYRVDPRLLEREAVPTPGRTP
jgi:hypothetical protein